MVGTPDQIVGFDENGNIVAIDSIRDIVAYIDVEDNENVENPEGIIIIDPTLSNTSTNPVQNKAVTSAINSKQDKLTGSKGQVVGFDENGIAVAQEASTPDWNTNDESDPSYIKNRPFYSNGIVEEIIADNVSLEFESWGGEGVYGAYIQYPLELVEGNTYIIEFDGVTYECVAQQTAYDYVAIGNAYKADAGEWHNNEPFFIYNEVYGVIDVTAYDIDVNSTHTISITERKEDITTIPMKYIKDMYGEIDEENAILLDSEIVQIESINEEYGYGEYRLSQNIELIQGETYTVDFNGTIYKCIAMYSEGAFFLGNGSIVNASEDTGEPFLLIAIPELNEIIVLIPTVGTYTVSISGLKRTIKKVPDKYLKNSNIMNGSGYKSVQSLSSTASGIWSHAEGDNTTASGRASHAEGIDTTASGWYQHAQGKYNISDTTSAHIVGNGTSTSKRSNAHTLDWNGNAWFAGDVYVGSTSGVNKDEGSKKLVTVDEMNEAIAAAIQAAFANIARAEEVEF